MMRIIILATFLAFIKYEINVVENYQKLSHFYQKIDVAFLILGQFLKYRPATLFDRKNIELRFETVFGNFQLFWDLLSNN